MDDKLEEIFGDDVENRSMEVYDEMVTAMAGSIYSELEKLIGDYGQGAVTGLMPLLVTVLESLEATCAQAREREEQLELVQEDKQRLLIQYERERDGRKRAEERCMEMEDGIEQERKHYKANLLTMEAQTKNMEMKARSYADQIVGLEEQRAQLTKELSSLTQVHTKVMKSYKELRSQRSLSMEAGRLSGRNTPLQGIEKKTLLLDFQEAPLSLESVPDHECPESPNSHTVLYLCQLRVSLVIFMLLCHGSYLAEGSLFPLAIQGRKINCITKVYVLYGHINYISYLISWLVNYKPDSHERCSTLFACLCLVHRNTWCNLSYGTQLHCSI
uniref:C-Jun-amino-terminal kinase-interacting protein 4 n=1 Tax=Xenopus tropicalis TaxID=8364 RepID=A0A803JA16_XENTR